MHVIIFIFVYPLHFSLPLENKRQTSLDFSFWIITGRFYVCLQSVAISRCFSIEMAVGVSLNFVNSISPFALSNDSVALLQATTGRWQMAHPPPSLSGQTTSPWAPTTWRLSSITAVAKTSSSLSAMPRQSSPSQVPHK